MAKEITEIENSSNDNKKPIAQIKKRDKGFADFNNSKTSNAIRYTDIIIARTEKKRT